MIVVDWGTTSFRAYRLTVAGAVMEQRDAPLGIMSVPPAGFADALFEQIGDWLPQEPGDIWMAGMIGSRQGWVEAPYVPCPAGIADIAKALTAIDWHGRTIRLAPGISYMDAEGVPDAIRGEEMQIFGVMDTIGDAPATVCLPGTHSKWVRVADGRILGFRTHMTGETFGLYRNHSILGRLMPADAKADDEAAFLLGIDRSAASGGLLNHLFSVRTRGLFGELAPEALPSYLSGILIGHEIRAALWRAPDGAIHLIAEPALAALYARALKHVGRQSHIHAPAAAATGLFRLSQN